jgi:hypothetical protein
VRAVSEDIRPYGVELTESDIAELRETGELRYQYATSEGDSNVEVVLKYSGDDDDRNGGGHKVTTTLR